MPELTAQVLHLEPGDEIALQYLGAAVVLQWDALPERRSKRYCSRRFQSAGCALSLRSPSKSSRLLGAGISSAERADGEKRPVGVTGNRV